MCGKSPQVMLQVSVTRWTPANSVSCTFGFCCLLLQLRPRAAGSSPTSLLMSTLNLLREVDSRRVTGLDCVENELAGDENEQRAVATDRHVHVPGGLILVSIG